VDMGAPFVADGKATEADALASVRSTAQRCRPLASAPCWALRRRMERARHPA
jgi:hypothetical protein